MSRKLLTNGAIFIGTSLMGTISHSHDYSHSDSYIPNTRYVSQPKYDEKRTYITYNGSKRYHRSFKRGKIKKRFKQNKNWWRK